MWGNLLLNGCLCLQVKYRGAIKRNLEPDSLRAAVSTEFVEGLWDNESSSSKHGPTGVNQLVCLISAIKASPLVPYDIYIIDGFVYFN